MGPLPLGGGWRDGFMETYVFYPCDPEKNVFCGKRNCAVLSEDGTCRLTTHSEFAADLEQRVEVKIE